MSLSHLRIGPRIEEFLKSAYQSFVKFKDNFIFQESNIFIKNFLPGGIFHGDYRIWMFYRLDEDFLIKYYGRRYYNSMDRFDKERKEFRLRQKIFKSFGVTLERDYRKDIIILTDIKERSKLSVEQIYCLNHYAHFGYEFN